VSSPERVTQGVNPSRGAQSALPGGTKKTGSFAPARQVLLCTCTAQVEGRTPRALALATARVRLWAPSFA